MQGNKIVAGSNKILLTGGTGYLGSAITAFYLDKKWEVTVLIRSGSSTSRLEITSPLLKCVEISSFNGGVFDVFLHAATSYGRNGESVEEVEKANIDFPLEILNKINKDNLHFINIGTSLPKELNIYSKTKKEFIERVRTNFKELDTTNVILEQFFGPKDGTFISFIVEQLHKDEAIDLTQGEQKRDFIYYKDVVTALFHITSNRVLDDIPLGSGIARSIKETVLLVRKVVNKENVDLKFGEVPYRKNEVMNSKADITKITESGWEAKYTFEQALKEMTSL